MIKNLCRKPCNPSLRGGLLPLTSSSLWHHRGIASMSDYVPNKEIAKRLGDLPDIRRASSNSCVGMHAGQRR